MLEGNPDLYGPFWIATTVVFILFLGGTINNYLATEGVGHFSYNFRLLSGMLSYGRYGLAHELNLNRRRWTHLRLHSRNPCRTLPRPQVLRQRFSQPTRVLCFVWILKPDLDPRCLDRLVSNQHSELGVCRTWVWT